jgi:hypothetical protein
VHREHCPQPYAATCTRGVATPPGWAAPLAQAPMNTKLAQMANLISGTERAFLYSASFVLLLTGLAKLVTAVQNRAGVMTVPDDVIWFLSQRAVLVVGGVIEIAVAVAIPLLDSTVLRLRALSFICAVFLAYRLGLSIRGVQSYCPCMGALYQNLRVSARTAEAIMRGVLGYLVSGSILFQLFEAKTTGGSMRTLGGGVT